MNMPFENIVGREVKKSVEIGGSEVRAVQKTSNNVSDLKCISELMIVAPWEQLSRVNINSVHLEGGNLCLHMLSCSLEAYLSSTCLAMKYFYGSCYSIIVQTSLNADRLILKNGHTPPHSATPLTLNHTTYTLPHSTTPLTLHYTKLHPHTPQLKHATLSLNTQQRKRVLKIF
ncbi:hypothetical protein HELRODRAFT_162772 [Helobdella robusta]|uniref:Uncharacterized protein n=1 Tax=Helobdella robusta TaxID=6412 RepID=T1ET43_HELRO|nr:hypothetical protein HELRODRAFT_162772 [Helobdella robusta]ESN99254.1 hypothetical protein HELRODRAFT_162772 [Helobdella robusta]